MKSEAVKPAVMIKIVRIRSYSEPYFPTFGLNNSEYGHISRSETLSSWPFPSIEPENDRTHWKTECFVSNYQIFVCNCSIILPNPSSWNVNVWYFQVLWSYWQLQILMVLNMNFEALSLRKIKCWATSSSTSTCVKFFISQRGYINTLKWAWKVPDKFLSRMY